MKIKNIVSILLSVTAGIIGGLAYSHLKNNVERILEQQEEELAKCLFNADPNCKHEIISTWNGIECTKCGGWCSL